MSSGSAYRNARYAKLPPSLQQMDALTISRSGKKRAEKYMALSGIQGACAAWRNAVNLLAKSFELEPLHTRAPRKDFEKLLTTVVQKYEAGASAVALQDKRQAYRDLEIVQRENRRLLEIIEVLTSTPPRPRPLWRTRPSEHSRSH